MPRKDILLLSLKLDEELTKLDRVQRLNKLVLSSNDKAKGLDGVSVGFLVFFFECVNFFSFKKEAS